MTFVATRLGIGYKVRCYGSMGRLRTTRALWWLLGLALYHKAGFRAYFSRFMIHRVLCRYIGSQTKKKNVLAMSFELPGRVAS